MSIKNNVIANYAGSIFSGMMSLIFIPLYIRLMGIEAFGLIGIFISLMALLSVLDMGLSSTLSRELARLSSSERAGRESRDLVRTLEIVYWGTGLCMGLGLAVLSPTIAHYWVRTQTIPAQTVQYALMIMGIIAAVQWPVALYEGGLIGLQRQVLLNTLRVAAVTLQHVGAVLLLWFYSPSILTYFAWQIAVSMLQTALLAFSVWASLPACPGASRFSKDILIRNWRFAAGMTGISIMTIILTQLDKLILSRLLTLDMFGYYVLASNIAGTLNYLVNPIFTAFFPKFVQLVARGSDIELSALYHKGSQLLSLVIFPASFTLFFFSREILALWIGHQGTENDTPLLLSMLALAVSCTALMHVPYAAQLAHGWTRLTFFQNLCAALLIVPSMFIAVNAYGIIGAAIVLITVNAGYIVILLPIMHRRILRQDMWSWYLIDTGKPLLIVFSATYLVRIAMPAETSAVVMLIWIIGCFLTALMAVSFSTPFVRAEIRRSLLP